MRPNFQVGFERFGGNFSSKIQSFLEYSDDDSSCMLCLPRRLSTSTKD